MKQKLTSVKVDIKSWDSFRKLSIDEKITFRELVKISLMEFINRGVSPAWPSAVTPALPPEASARIPAC